MNYNREDRATEVENKDLIAHLLSVHSHLTIIHDLSLSPFEDERLQERMRKVQDLTPVALIDFYEVYQQGDEGIERWIEHGSDMACGQLK